MRITNAAHIENIEAVQPIKPSQKINKFIDFKYKLERNEYNRWLYLKCQRLKMTENFLKLQNNADTSIDKTSFKEKLACKYNELKDRPSSVKNSESKFDLDRISAYSKLILEAELKKQMHDFNNKVSYAEIISSLNKCHKDLIDFASMTLLINASYLISPTAVLALLNFKDKDV